MNFLNAEWVDLILANYVVEPEILSTFVPEKTTLDYHENKCYLSLVAFMFRQTRILGCPIPYHINFEEVNLRFYVKPNYDYSERSVTFIKEIVPLKTIPFVANNFFKENYVALPMSHKISHPNISYSWGKYLTNTFSVSFSNTPEIPQRGSTEEFITEHYFGFTKNGSETIRYKVNHPQWKVSGIESYSIKVNFSEVCGDEFAFLNSSVPENVCYAVGSKVGVSFPSKLV